MALSWHVYSDICWAKPSSLRSKKKPAKEHVDVIQTVFGAPGGEHQYYDPELKME